MKHTFALVLMAALALCIDGSPVAEKASTSTTITPNQSLKVARYVIDALSCVFWMRHQIWRTGYWMEVRFVFNLLPLRSNWWKYCCFYFVGRNGVVLCTIQKPAYIGPAVTICMTMLSEFTVRAGTLGPSRTRNDDSLIPNDEFFDIDKKTEVGTPALDIIMKLSHGQDHSPPLRCCRPCRLQERK